MSGLLFDVCWLLGGILSALVIHKGFHAGWWSVTKPQPPTAPLSEAQSRRIHDASKRIVKADFNRSF